MPSYAEEAQARINAQAEAEERAKYRVDLRVLDKDYDVMDFPDVGSFSVTGFGMLAVFDHNDRTIAGYAAGAWTEFHVTREDRVEFGDNDDADAPE